MVFSAVQNSDLLNCLVSDQILQINSAFIDLNNIVMAFRTPLGYDIKTSFIKTLFIEQTDPRSESCSISSLCRPSQSSEHS